jgi:hypothetical protein
MRWLRAFSVGVLMLVVSFLAGGFPVALACSENVASDTARGTVCSAVDLQLQPAGWALLLLAPAVAAFTIAFVLRGRAMWTSLIAFFVLAGLAYASVLAVVTSNLLAIPIR